MTKVKEITSDIRDNIDTQKMLIRILIVGSAFMILLYVYLIGSITFNVVARKSLEKNVIELTNKVNDLNITYLNNINMISKEYAISKGFVEIPQNIFASRDINHVAIR